MSRVEQALTEIARRRVITDGARKILGDDDDLVDAPWPTAGATHPGRLATRMLTSHHRAAHILENDPVHVLAVLDAAEATLRRHAPIRSGGLMCPEPDGLPEVECDACLYGDGHEGDVCQHCWGAQEGEVRRWPCAEVAPLLAIYAGEGG